MQNQWDIVIVGGGLAGLTCALHLAQHSCKVALIEKTPYPQHRVCGEYVSNEVLPYLQSLGVDPLKAGAKFIDTFQISNKQGKILESSLPLGGFGISRYAFDLLLYETVKDNITVLFETVEAIDFKNENFHISTQENNYSATYLVGAYGKRANLDIKLQREFIQQKSPWLAVKAHYTYDFPENKVALHNFEGGYCGLSKTETDAVNACYLTTYASFKRFGNITDFQNKVLSVNPHLKHFFKHAQPLFEKPLTISQISFSEKEIVQNHILMIGDSAGLIHPLCGNGMAMAIHSAKIAATLLLQHLQEGSFTRLELENNYKKQWKKTFSKRLANGRNIQTLLLRPMATRVGFSIAAAFPHILPSIIKRTHGTPIY